MKKAFTLFVLAFLAFNLNAQTLKTLTWGGQQRQYYEYIPSTYSEETSAPVLFMLHGMGDEAANFFGATNFTNVAEEKGWILVYPQALEFNVEIPYVGGYNFGTCWAAGITLTITFDVFGTPISYDVSVNGNVDDAGFLTATMSAIEEEYNVDQDSIFFAGFSLGACMCHRMAIEHGDEINAIAAVSGVVCNDMQNLTPPDNINVLEIYGTSDEMMTYDSAMISLQQYGTHSVGLPVEATVEYWRSFNNCDVDPLVEQYPDTQNDGLNFTMYNYLNGDNGARVNFIKVDNGLHRWYTGGSYDIDYKDEIVKFFTNNLDVTGVEENDNNSLSLWPNPANDFIQVGTDDEACIYDLSGRLVLTGKDRINVSTLSNGLYFIKAGTQHQKLLINH